MKNVPAIIETAPEPTPQPEPAQAVTPAEIINSWFAEYFHNQPGLYIGTELFNHIHAAKEALKLTLAPFKKEA